jgi:hypothetical protein
MALVTYDKQERTSSLKKRSKKLSETGAAMFQAACSNHRKSFGSFLQNRTAFF